MKISNKIINNIIGKNIKKDKKSRNQLLEEHLYHVYNEDENQTGIQQK